MELFIQRRAPDIVDPWVSLENIQINHYNSISKSLKLKDAYYYSIETTNIHTRTEVLGIAV